MTRTQVLVTRTGSEGQLLVRKLEALGFDAMHLPLVRLTGVDDPERVRQQATALPQVDGLILTSREGVRQAANLGLLKDWRDVLTVVPGQGTRALALEVGMRRVHCPRAGAGNSEAMLALAELQGVAGTDWVILAARDGRRVLDQELVSRGAKVHRLTIYRRCSEPADRAAINSLRTGQNWVTLLASGGALDRLSGSLPPGVWDTLRRGVMIVPSERLRLRAIDCGVSNVIVSAGASDQAMLAALMHGPSAV